MKSEPILYVIVILALIVFAVLVVATFKWGHTGTPIPTNSSMLVITASGTVFNKSSQGTIYLSINGTGATNQQAVQNISATLQKFNSTILKYVNSNLSQISTSYFNVYKLYNKSGYEAMESLSVTIPNINNVSPAIGAISNISNVFVNDAQPKLSDAQTSAMRVKALTFALANATSQARALIGNKTIYTTNISVNNFYVYPFKYGTAVAAGGQSVPQASNTTITPQFYGGLNQVTESVTVTFYYSRT
jgi:uncharacterized protein YggE